MTQSELISVTLLSLLLARGALGSIDQNDIMEDYESPDDFVDFGVVSDKIVVRPLPPLEADALDSQKALLPAIEPEIETLPSVPMPPMDEEEEDVEKVVTLTTAVAAHAEKTTVADPRTENIAVAEPETVEEVTAEDEEKKRQAEEAARAEWRVFLTDATAKPSDIRRKIEHTAVAEGREASAATLLAAADEAESRSRGALIALRSAVRDLDALLDLPADSRKEKKRLEDIGYAFVPLLNEALAQFRSSGAAGHRRLERVLHAMDSLDSLLFFADLPPAVLRERVVAWAEQPIEKAEKAAGHQLKARRKQLESDSGLLQRLLASVLAESHRSVEDFFDSPRLGRANLLFY